MLICACLPIPSVVSDPSDPTDCSPSGSSVPGIFQARILEWVAIPPPGDLLDPGIQPASPVSPAKQTDSLPDEPSLIYKVLFIINSQNLEKAMAPHSSTVAWKFPWMEEPGRL